MWKVKFVDNSKNSHSMYGSVKARISHYGNGQCAQFNGAQWISYENDFRNRIRPIAFYFKRYFSRNHFTWIFSVNHSRTIQTISPFAPSGFTWNHKITYFQHTDYLKPFFLFHLYCCFFVIEVHFYCVIFLWISHSLNNENITLKPFNALMFISLRLNSKNCRKLHLFHNINSQGPL